MTPKMKGWRSLLLKIEKQKLITAKVYKMEKEDLTLSNINTHSPPS